MIPTTQARPRTRRRVPLALVPVAASALALAWAGSALAAPPAVNLDFSQAVPGTVLDSNGVGTGFTSIQGNTGDTEDLPANRTLRPAQSLLSILTTEGDSKGNNRQQNALQVSFDGSNDFQVTGVLKGPVPITQDFQGGGIFVGPDQDQFAKMVVNQGSDGVPQVELHMDYKTAATGNQVLTKVQVKRPDGLLAATKIELSLGFDAQTGAFVGSFSLDSGPVTTMSFGAEFPLAAAVGPTASAGILATNFSSTTAPPITVNFDNFAVTGTATPVIIPGTPGTTVPGQTSSGELCAPVTPTPAPPTKTPAKVNITTGQLLINQRISQAAVRRLNAIQQWLDDGIVRDDICGGALTATKFGTGVTATTTTRLTALSSATPRPIVEKKASRGGASTVEITSGQLLINQRISQAAVRRANGLQERLNDGLTGGDIRNGQLTQSQLRQGLVITAATPIANPPAPSKTVIAPRTGGGGTVKVEASQLLIAQRISQAAVRRANTLRDKLLKGLQSNDFADSSITAIDLAPETIRP